MKYVVFVTLIVLAESRTETGVKYVNDIIKSPEDKRLYRGLILPNQMQVLLISDPETDKSAASLNVAVGHLSDPDDLPGLAHFCEHMLFMGSKKYPGQDEHKKFLSDHGGFANAFTSSDHTLYFFDVASDHLKGALDIFAQFFISPLMDKGTVDREVNAVDSEFQKYKANDAWRFLQLKRSTSKVGHPYNKFSVGTKTTLVTLPREKGIDVREELLNFHEKWYSANLMTLVVLGKESLDELEEMTVPIFSEVKNKNVSRPEWTDHPFGPDQVPSKTYLIPVQDVKVLYVSFPIPDLREHYKADPMMYVSRLLADQAPGGLTSVLKAKNWAYQLIPYGELIVTAKGFNFYTIYFDLTADGIGKVDEIITLVFQYLDLLRKSGTQKQTFEEFRKISEMSFRFQDKENPVEYVKRITQNQHNYEYPFEEILSGPRLVEEYRPDLIDMLLGYLKPSNVHVTIAAQMFENVTNKVEPWFGTKYKFEKIPEDVTRKWENCGVNNELKLPAPNKFIPGNFEILVRGKKRPTHPLVVHESNFTRVWLKQDDQFLLPKADLKFRFISPLIFSDPLNYSLTEIFIGLLKDALIVYTYPATLAGISCEIQLNYYGFSLNIHGFNDKQDVFLDGILENITNFQVDPSRFYDVKENLMRNYRNLKASEPYSLYWHYFYPLLWENSWTVDEHLEAIRGIKVEDVEQFISRFFSKLFVECLIHGNVDDKGANSLIRILERRLISKTRQPLTSEELLGHRVVRLNDGEYSVQEVSNEFHKSSCIATYYQCGGLSTANNMLVKLLHQIIEQPCFSVLRSREQLGYAVGSYSWTFFGAQGLIIAVQSDKHPDFVDRRIESFLVEMRKIIEEMSEEEFEKNKEALAAKKLAKPKNLIELSKKFWDEITFRKYNFDRDEIEVAYLRTITKTDFMTFFDDHVKEGSPKRRKLSVHIISHVEGGAGTLQGADLGLSNESAVPPSKIEDINSFKRSHGFYSLPEPYADVAVFKINKSVDAKYNYAFCNKPFSSFLFIILILDILYIFLI